MIFSRSDEGFLRRSLLEKEGTGEGVVAAAGLEKRNSQFYSALEMKKTQDPELITFEKHSAAWSRRLRRRQRRPRNMAGFGCLVSDAERSRNGGGRSDLVFQAKATNPLDLVSVFLKFI